MVPVTSLEHQPRYSEMLDNDPPFGVPVTTSADLLHNVKICYLRKNINFGRAPRDVRPLTSPFLLGVASRRPQSHLLDCHPIRRYLLKRECAVPAAVQIESFFIQLLERRDELRFLRALLERIMQNLYDTRVHSFWSAYAVRHTHRQIETGFFERWYVWPAGCPLFSPRHQEPQLPGVDEFCPRTCGA